MSGAGAGAARHRRLLAVLKELQRGPPGHAGGDARALPRGHRRGPGVLRRARAGHHARRASSARSCRRRRSAAAMLAVAHYMAAAAVRAAGTSTPASGTSSCPTRRTAPPRSRSTRGWRPTTTTALWSIAVHEAYPGHHWHFAWLACEPGRRRRSRRCAPSSARPTSSRAGASTPRTCCASRASSDARAGAVPARLPAVPRRPDHRRHLAAPRRDDGRGGRRLHVDQDVAVPRDRRRPRCCAIARGRPRRRPTSRARWRSPGCGSAGCDEARGSLRDFHDLAAGSGPAAVSLVERALFG